MDQLYDNEQLASLVGRVLRIEDTTIGSEKIGFIVRFRGRLYNEDSEKAYELLSQMLKPQNITPLFRMDDNLHAVILVKGLPKPKPSNPRVNLILFILTFLSVLFTGALFGMQELPAGNILDQIWAVMKSGLPFAVSMLAILGAHEFGHYLMGRYHGVHVTLPYFIPLPVISPFGTMGAFINMKEIPKNRKVLMDIGIAGPLAGLLVAVPVLFLGLYLSHVELVPSNPVMSYQFEGNSLFYLFAKYLMFGKLLPQPASYDGLTPFLFWLRYFFTGNPLPLGGWDVTIHSVAWAGWGGLLVTAMNLIPAGQLDGGHLMYVLLGRKLARLTFPFILGALVILGFFWQGWFLWAALVFFFGRTYAEPLDQITPIDGKRKLLAIIGLIAFVLTFTPIPLTAVLVP
jgi:membrane-associated protease RseP (regulator of RpoE activity)